MKDRYQIEPIPHSNKLRTGSSSPGRTVDIKYAGKQEVGSPGKSTPAVEKDYFRDVLGWGPV